MTSTNPRIPVPLPLANLDLTSPYPSSTTINNSKGNQTTNSNPSTILIPQTLPAPTRRAFLDHLQSSSSIPQLNELLTTTLHKCTTTQPPGAADWPSRVHALALELLRSGFCAPNFQDLMTEITRRALQPSQQQRESTRGRRNGERVGTIVLPSGSYGEDGLPDVRMPQEVVDKGVSFLEEKVRGNIAVRADEESKGWEGEE
jgi:hypothetical protein